MYKRLQTDIQTHVHRLNFLDSLNSSFMEFKMPLAKIQLYNAAFPKWISFNAACSGQLHSRNRLSKFVTKLRTLRRAVAACQLVDSFYHSNQLCTIWQFLKRLNHFFQEFSGWVLDPKFVEGSTRNLRLHTSSQTLSQTTYNRVHGRPFGRCP